MNRLRMKRLKQEVLALAVQYGEVQWDDKTGSWIIIRWFPLPKGLGKPITRLLITLPSGYPIVPPNHYDFYMEKGLHLQHHYYEYGHKRDNEDWAWFCLEIEGWRPSSQIWNGDNLLTLMEMVTVALSALAEQQRR